MIKIYVDASQAKLVL